MPKQLRDVIAAQQTATKNGNMNLVKELRDVEATLRDALQQPRPISAATFGGIKETKVPRAVSPAGMKPAGKSRPKKAPTAAQLEARKKQSEQAA